MKSLTDPSHTSLGEADQPQATIPAAASAQNAQDSPQAHLGQELSHSTESAASKIATLYSASQNATAAPHQKSWRGSAPIAMLLGLLRFLDRRLHSAIVFLSTPPQSPSPSPELIAHVDAQLSALWSPHPADAVTPSKSNSKDFSSPTFYHPGQYLN